MLIAEIKRAFMASEERHLLRSFGEQIEAMMAPFKAGRISVEIVESYSSISRFKVRVEHLGEFTFPLHPEEGLSLDDILLQLEEIYRESRVEPEEHIILGLE